MRHSLLPLLATVLVALLSNWSYAATTATAELGVAAPPIRIKEWVKGTTVTLEDTRGTSITVVEFWATWCAPCLQSIPYLTKIQKEFGPQGVEVIGISSEAPSTIRRFVEKQGERMDYRVGADFYRRTEQAYGQLFGVIQFPYAYVVDKEGRVIWSGASLGKLRPVLQQILNGTYDYEVLNQQARVADLFSSYTAMAAQGSPEARAMGERVLAESGNDGQVPARLATYILQSSRLGDRRDLELALKAAHKAVEVTEGKHAEHQDLYARTLSLNGRHAEAAEAEKKALEYATSDGLREHAQKKLEEYQKKAAAP